MNAFLRKGLTLALLSLFGNPELHAQLDLSKFEIGLTGGAFVYQGDLTPSQFGSYRTPRPTVNLFINRIISPVFSVRGSLFYGGLLGNDAAYQKPEWRQQRSLNFSSSALELSALLIWNAWSTEKKLVPYLFGGAGFTLLNIKRDWSHFNGEFFSNEDLGTRVMEDVAHATPKMIPVVPVGIGVQYSLSKKLSVTAETAYRLTRTDYLDGFSKAGNPELTDHYQSHTIGLLYRFGKKSSLNCPTIIQ